MKTIISYKKAPEKGQTIIFFSSLSRPLQPFSSSLTLSELLIKLQTTQLRSGLPENGFF